MIEYVTKERMAEVSGDSRYFGFAFPSKKLAYVRDDLPRLVQKSVAIHERYHLDDVLFYERPVWKRELLAFLAQLIQQPIGTLMLLVMSLRISRIKLIIKRILTNA